MKGVVFTEFTEMVETTYGFDMVDALIKATNLPSGGVYVSTGTYDHAELVAMVGELSERTGTPVPDLLAAFGRFLMPRFRRSFPGFFEPHDSLFAFLDSVHTYIHVEVRKLYPDAELPQVMCEQVEPNVLHMTYRSTRHLEDLGRGLIEGAAAAYDTEVEVRPHRIDADSVRFEIVRTDT